MPEARVPMIPISRTPIKSKSPSDDCKKMAKVNLRLLRWSRRAKDFFCNLQNSTSLPYLMVFDEIIGVMEESHAMKLYTPPINVNETQYIFLVIFTVGHKISVGI